MEPGYYLSEVGHFQIWYPKDFFKKGYQRLDVVYTDRYGITRTRTEEYPEEMLKLLLSVLEFEYIGGL